MPRSDLAKLPLETLIGMLPTLTPGQFRAAGVGLKLAERFFDDVIALIGAGETVFAACEKACPGLTLQTLKNFVNRNPVMLKRFRAAMKTRGGRVGKRATLTACSPESYDEALRVIATTAKPIRNAIGPGLPVRQTLRRRAAEDHLFAVRLEAAFAAHYALPGTRWEYDEAEWNAALDLIRNEPTRSMRKALANRPAGIPSESSIKNRMARDVAFRKRVVKMRGGRGKPKSSLDTLASAYQAIDAVVPRTFAPADRGDICGDMIADVVSGRLQPGDIKARVGAYVKAHLKSFYSVAMCSLDAPLSPDDDLTFLDIKTADAEIGAWCV